MLTSKRSECLIVQMTFPVFVFFLLPFCPESPRWLASRGASLKEVASVLALLEGKGATDTSPHILSLANEIILVAQHEAELEASTTWRDVSSPVAAMKPAGLDPTFQANIIDPFANMIVFTYRHSVVESSKTVGACF